jgi:uncharacterized membrane protein
MLPNAHPLIVHFPIALLIVAGIFAILYVFSDKTIYKELLFWNLIIGTIGLYGAIITGIIASNTIVHNEEIHEIMTIHKYFGLTSTILFTILSLWLILRKSKLVAIEQRIFTFIIIVCIVVMTYGSFLGGKMVYEKGAAVKPMEKTFIQEEGGEHHHHHDHDNDHDKDHDND